MPIKKEDAMIVGNWKMHKTLPEAEDFLSQLKPEKKVYLAVPFTLIYPLAQKKYENVGIGAQNMNDASEGAFTGEVSARMLIDAGAEFVLLGHSERRHVFKETDSFINMKVLRAIKDDLKFILCVGETADEHEKELSHQVIETQIIEGLKNVEDLNLCTLAYEPVWSIGTGENADPEDAEKTHAFIRKLIGKKWGKSAASSLKILYGGSVKPENGENYLKEADINGLLIGGASLNVESFAKLSALNK